MMLVNVKSALYGIQAVLPHFRARGRGQIINISSMLGRVPLASFRSAYSASKHALNALTANLRMELRVSHPGIAVSSVHPGIVATEFGLRALHGGVDSRQLPSAQSAGRRGRGHRRRHRTAARRRLYVPRRQADGGRVLRRRGHGGRRAGADAAAPVEVAASLHFRRRRVNKAADERSHLRPRPDGRCRSRSTWCSRRPAWRCRCFMVIADVLWTAHAATPTTSSWRKRLAKGTAILFAVGAVSGTVLSFELGLLWPRFMGTFGEIIGLPFALEGFAFFTEAIFLGIYLYGRDRISAAAAPLRGRGGGVCGALSAFFVTLVNACMNLPAGFGRAAARPRTFDPAGGDVQPAVAAPDGARAALVLPGHGVRAGGRSTRLFLLRDPRERCTARRSASRWRVRRCADGALQPLSGTLGASARARSSPLKLAAAEAHFHTERGARPSESAACPTPTAARSTAPSRSPAGSRSSRTDDLDARGAAGSTRSRATTGRPSRRRTWPSTPWSARARRWRCSRSGGGARACAGAACPTARWFLPRGGGRRGPARPRRARGRLVVTELGRQPWIVRGALRTARRGDAVPLPGGAVLDVHARLRLPRRRRRLPALRQLVAARHARRSGPAPGGSADAD